MITKPLLGFLLSNMVFAGAFLALPNSAAALSCGTHLVAVGDSQLYVRDVCGEPAQATTRTETRTQWISGPYGAGGSSISVTVQVDVWLMDFGPGRFMEELTFENGTLRSMRSRGYGRTRRR